MCCSHEPGGPASTGAAVGIAAVSAVGSAGAAVGSAGASLGLAAGLKHQGSSYSDKKTCII